MPIRYFFKQLLLPPGGLLLLLLAAWWLRRRAPRLAALCFVLGFGGLWLMSLPVTVEWAGRALEREAPLERLRFAARLAKASGLPILASGGLHYGQPPSEAQLAAEALQRDFSTTTRWLEERSRTTWENALYSASMLKDAGIDRIVLVTSASHMPRSRWCFEQNGLQVIVAPMGFVGVPNGRPFGGWLPETKAVWQNGLLLNEALGMLIYPLLYGGSAD